MTRIFVGLGSNIQKPMDQLSIAYRHLDDHALLETLQVSRVYLSSPMGPTDQPDFYNAAVQIQTRLEPTALLRELQQIEQRMGRVNTRHWGERCIDLDLLLFDDLVLESCGLQLPHPRAHERCFVLDPLIELVGEGYPFPGKETLGQLRSRCSEQTIRVLCEFPD